METIVRFILFVFGVWVSWRIITWRMRRTLTIVRVGDHEARVITQFALLTSIWKLIIHNTLRRPRLMARVILNVLRRPRV